MLYHGSSTLLHVIEPRYSNLVNNNAVFATSVIDVAISFSVPWTDSIIEHGSINDQMYMKEMVPGAFKVLERSSYIHVIDNKDFRNHPNLTRYEVISFHSAPVLYVHKVENVRRYMEESGFRMFKYEDEINI